MTLRTVALIALAVFLILFGLMSVTNLVVNHMAEICGFAALIAGILIGIWAFRQSP